MSSELAVEGLKCVLGLGITGAFVFAALRWDKKRREALKADISDSECVSCGSKDVTELSPGAYRCNECGYEGGSGVQAAKDEAKKEKVASLSDEDKRIKALKIIAEGQRVLDAHLGALSGTDVGEHLVDELIQAESEVGKVVADLKDLQLLMPDAIDSLPELPDYGGAFLKDNLRQAGWLAVAAAAASNRDKANASMMELKATLAAAKKVVEG